MANEQTCHECGTPILEGRLNCIKCGTTYPSPGERDLERNPEEQEDLRAALEAGAKGYILKSSNYDALIESLVAIAEGQAVTLPKLASPPPATPPTAPRASRGERQAELSERELEVLRLLAQGASNRQIADQLFLSENTVRTYVAHILEKLGLENRVQAAAYALRSGLVS